MEHGYHGDTIGAMSVGERGVFNHAYESLLFEVDQLPFPKWGLEQITLDTFEKYCRTGKVAALLIEPLILGAGGFKIYPAWVLTELKRIAEKYKVLVIADEVMTGWGRTGTLFACEQANISPDILCTSKGLTGGSLPLAATLCTAEIFNAHFSPDRRKTFFHSSSYTANPIACAAALANIKIWETEPVFEKIKTIENLHRERLLAFKSDNRFSNVRQIGTIVALDFNITDSGYLSEIGLKLSNYFRERHLMIRPLGNVLYLMMPYCVTIKDIDQTYHAIHEAANVLMMTQS
jgi:adenosylmethionine-8-amino-7-oxononanoate aminotransferase